MDCKRFIPCIYLYRTNAVRTLTDLSVVDTDPVRLARRFSDNNADEIIVLNNGKVAKVGTPSDILYDEKLLKENSLLPPFVVEVKNALKEEGIEIDECFTMEELVSKL